MIRRGSSRLGCVVPVRSFLIFGVLSWRFSWSDFGTFLLRIWWGCMCEPFVVLFPLISLPNSWVKGLNFGVFNVLGLEEFVAGFLRFLLIWQVLVDTNLAMDCPWGVPTISKVLRKSVERFGRSRVGFGGVDPRVLFIPRAQATPVWPVPLTGLTGADPDGFCSGERLGDFFVIPFCCCFEFGSFWSSVGLFGVLGLSGLNWSDRWATPSWLM
jgi:hypothetical protein